MSPLSAVTVAVVLVVVRALALAAESGLVAASREALKDSGASLGTQEAFAWLKDRPEASFAALRALSILSLALAAAAGAVVGEQLLGGFARVHLPSGPAALLGPAAGGLGVAALATLVDLPIRALAAAYPLGAAARSAAVLRLVVRLTRPPLALVTGLTQLALRPLGLKAVLGPPRPALEELQQLLLEEAHRHGIDPQGPKLIRNIFEMSEKTARDVMLQRTQLVALDIQTPPEEILQLLAEHGHSRMPVYRGDIDQVVGILHARDLVPMLQHPELIVLQDILRPAHFIPWSKPVGEILREMQKKKIHMALVVDEYGGLLGMVTLEDVLEVIVGEIRDEYDDETKEIEPSADGSFLVRASISLESFAKAFGVELPEGDYETLGGFLNYLAGCIPEAGEKLYFGGLQFAVQDRTLRRLRRVRVQKLSSPPSPDPRKKATA